MAENKSGDFEAKLARLEEIVRQLEGGNVKLEASVDLFKEGRGLAKACEELLAAAQQTIESVAAGNGSTEKAPASGAGSLFDDDALA